MVKRRLRDEIIYSKRVKVGNRLPNVGDELRMRYKAQS
jgi:hypothetical protein